MVRANRIKEYRFSRTEMTAASDGTVDVYTSYPLNGLLQAIQWIGGNHTATGSIAITVSGTGETIWNLTSGLNYVGETFTKFPRASCVTTSNISLGSNVGDEYAEIPLKTLIRVAGAGLGDGTSGLGLNIGYI